MIQTLAITGIVLSIYSLYISYSNKKHLCDISENISCSKAMKSKFSSFFGIKNAYYGIIYYLIVIFIPKTFFAYFGAGLALLFSLYLSFLLFRDRNFCIVCILAHITNILLFFLIYF